VKRNGKCLWVNGAVVLVLLAALVGCKPHMGDAGIKVPADEITGLREMLNALRAEVGLVAKAPPACFTDEVVAFVREERGTMCSDFVADIGAFAEACVVTPDNKARLNVAVAEAGMECKRFCIAEKGCPTWTYIPPRDCASPQAYVDSSCPGNCPVRNYCALASSTSDFRCQCR